jgi:hypothetical protein
MTVYQEHRSYSPIFDKEMVRLSITDDSNREFFIQIPGASGKSFREAREQAIAILEQAIAEGLPPGEITVIGGGDS